jgi:hypothetical protein
MLKLFGLFERDGGCSTHIIIFVVDWQFNLFFVLPDFMVLLIVFLVKLDIDFNRPCKSTKE